MTASANRSSLLRSLPRAVRGGVALILLLSLFCGPAGAQPEAEPDAVYEAPSPATGAAFGAAIADAGDVDGDGR